jgi:hypothetical protein
MNPKLLKMQRGSRMRAINEKREIPRTKKFGGVTYHLAYVSMYKSQADHYADAVRFKGKLARVVPGSAMAGEHKMKNCWRVYIKE